MKSSSFIPNHIQLIPFENPTEVIPSDGVKDFLSRKLFQTEVEVTKPDGVAGKARDDSQVNESVESEVTHS